MFSGMIFEVFSGGADSQMAWRKLVSTSLSLAVLFSTMSLGMGPALAAGDTSTVQVAQDANLGTILTGPNGMTLYHFKKDTPNVSNCYDKCAVNWPPLLLKDGAQPQSATGLTGNLGTTTRKNGDIQATYNGWPLYYWSKDKAPGDTTGQNVSQVWFVLNPDSATVKLAQDPSLGTLLTDAAGMSLYVFTKDAPGVTNCYEKCAINWPPLLLKDGALLNAPAGLAGKLGTTMRKDGTLQVTLNGAPLYHWSKDKMVGDTFGHKFSGVWFVSQPGLLLDAAGTWAQSQIASAVRSGWVNGTPGGNFQPNRDVTRAEYVKMLTLAMGTPSSAAVSGFSDIGSHWASSVIQAAVAGGIVNVADYAAGVFGPDMAISREEAAAMLTRAVGLDRNVVSGAHVMDRFTDANQLSAKYAGLVSLAVEYGLVHGYTDDTIHGEKTITRAEAVTLILRALSIK
jgi:predicted lipoprotein with Yx(FWY)xxD motif